MTSSDGEHNRAMMDTEPVAGQILNQDDEDAINTTPYPLLIAIGAVVLVALIGFVTGHWILGGATFPALLLVTLGIGFYTFYSPAAEDHTDSEEDPLREETPGPE